MSKRVVNRDGNILWYNDKGELHREDGPAVEHVDGYKAWYINNMLHRENGPAQEYANGHKIWAINDQSVTEEEFNKYMLNKNLMKLL